MWPTFVPSLLAWSLSPPILGFMWQATAPIGWTDQAVAYVWPYFGFPQWESELLLLNFHLGEKHTIWIPGDHEVPS